MPPNSTFGGEKEDALKKETFQKLFNQILTYANQHNALRRNLMSILYRFVCENAKPLLLHQRPPK